MEKIPHSVRLDVDKCKGCTNCIKHCPTEAIRVRGGKARIIDDRCIDCGECIRVCPHHAKRAVYDKLADIIGKYKWLVALPAPSLWGQFNNLDDMDYVIEGLKKIGFNDVYEVSKAAEIVSDYTRMLLNKRKLKKPVISSACPAVVKLISVRFPSLIENVLPILAPVELAAKLARREAVKGTGFKPTEIGCVFISPCPAKVTAAKNPMFTADSNIDATVSMGEIYLKLVGEMKRSDLEDELSETGRIGLSWGASGGEAAAVLKDKYLAADGIKNVIRVLEEIENDKLDDMDFIELNACTGGCVGGVLTIENPFVAKTRLYNLRKYLPVAKNVYNFDVVGTLDADRKYRAGSSMRLNGDVNTALHMVNQIAEVQNHLPGLDCGSCGAPTCRALAEDVVGGFAQESDCVFKLREKIAGLYNEVFGGERYHNIKENEGSDKK
ncbi:MAG: [Fe-Fe] hydrogenase large subunit C-terminal domain-containing protein [Bacillota bacterium]|nr:[Fe-Fe] hydrogenase large subunit C-terminal domain-containing protein [Bacillota bacterium]